MIMNQLTKILYLLIAAVILYATLKILNYYLLSRFAKAKAEAMCSRKKQKRLNKLEEKQQKELNDLIYYNSNISKSYEKARDLFNMLMKTGTLKREQIIYLKKLIDDSLGDYKIYYTKRYKNDAHEIYSKLSSTHISYTDFQKIIEYLELFI